MFNCLGTLFFAEACFDASCHRKKNGASAPPFLCFDSFFPLIRA